MSIDTFAGFGLSETVLAALKTKGFVSPTPIQAISLPRLLADEGHLIVKARTGTGKTAAFGIPLVERFTSGTHAPRALILTPTRELCQQICKEIASLTTRPFPRITAVYGGASIRSQILNLKRGTEIVAGTPGRVMDLMERKALDLSCVDYFILDEADEMLDMGFFEDVESILKAVKPERRIALFSATMPDPILKIVKKHIGNAEILEDGSSDDEKPVVDQFYLIVKKEDRLEALRRIIDAAEEFYGLIFCATKIGADELAHRLVENGYAAEAIHGDLSQEARDRTLRRFRSKMTTILVATDVAARGLDIERLTHVVNFDLPNDKETYIHRIGRTGRAGRSGRAITLALPGERQRINRLSLLMERSLGNPIAFTKAPHVKTVMKALKRRILNSVLASLPEEFEDAEKSDIIENTENLESQTIENRENNAEENEKGEKKPTLLSDPVSSISRDLIEKLGAERAVEALIALSYGGQLDPSRYAPITEFQEAAPQPYKETFSKHFSRSSPASPRAGRHSFSSGRFSERSRRVDFEESTGTMRIYVGLGRQQGASAREVAKLLSRAGGVPGALVDAIEIKDFCAFATMPEGAARRAVDYSRKNKDSPLIKPAVSKGK